MANEWSLTRNGMPLTRQMNAQGMPYTGSTRNLKGTTRAPREARARRKKHQEGIACVK